MWDRGKAVNVYKKGCVRLAINKYVFMVFVVRCHKYCRIVLIIVWFSLLPFGHAIVESSEVVIFDCLYTEQERNFTLTVFLNISNDTYPMKDVLKSN